MSFADLGLSEEVMRAVSDAGYTDPTPIQKAPSQMSSWEEIF